MRGKKVYYCVYCCATLGGEQEAIRHLCPERDEVERTGTFPATQHTGSIGAYTSCTYSDGVIAAREGRHCPICGVMHTIIPEWGPLPTRVDAPAAPAPSDGSPPP